MDILEAIYARRAVRLYKGDPVDDQTLRQLIDAAIQAPSAVNEQPWSFIVVRDRALLKRISQEAKAHMLKSTPAALLSHHFQELLSDPSFDIFYDAPALIVICCTTDNAWAVEDCALAAENLMLAAVAEGLLDRIRAGLAQIAGGQGHPEPDRGRHPDGPHHRRVSSGPGAAGSEERAGYPLDRIVTGMAARRV